MTESLYITSHCDWTQSKIEQVYSEIEKIALTELELDGLVYPNSIEIITAEQMLDAYSSVGLPVHYNHWSFGKDFLRNAKSYEKGYQGLAYEIVINSNPCISYLMEENLLYMQALVIAHAAFGHNAVFKNNICFKQWTNAGSIIDYMIFARDYIRKCEERYGIEEVEYTLDAAHALAPHGIDKYKRKHNTKLSEEQILQKLLDDDNQEQIEKDIVLEKTSVKNKKNKIIKEKNETNDLKGEENLLYYIIKKSPSLPQWKREILRIVYKVHQYFYAQSQTKILNEGFATFTHYYIMKRLEEKGILSPDAYIAVLHSHTGVVQQRHYHSRYYSGFNPYALGFDILTDIRRICENPTNEDREWFPNLIGRRWQDAIKEAAFEHRDDSFIQQYLSPKVIRDWKLFSLKIENTQKAIVSEIHDEIGYSNLRTILARTNERINYVPQIEVIGANFEKDRTLSLRYIPHQNRQLNEKEAKKVTDYVRFLWGYPVELLM